MRLRRLRGVCRPGHLLEAKTLRYVLGQTLVNVEQVRDHTGADRRCFDLAQLEGERVGDVLLFALRLADVKLPCLTIVVGEGLRADAQFGALLRGGVGVKAFLG
jgi:hypothetical protein